MTGAPTILFVDDEPNVLSGLRRATRRKRDMWDMIFVQSGQEALRTISRLEVDVLVADMRMPGMDGATLIERVAEVSPSTIRIILSGQSDADLIARAINKSHRFLAKPLDPAIMADIIEEVLKQREGHLEAFEAPLEVTVG